MDASSSTTSPFIALVTQKIYQNFIRFTPWQGTVMQKGTMENCALEMFEIYPVDG